VSPGQSCSCGLQSWTSIFSNIYYVAFVDSGTDNPVNGFPIWVPDVNANNSWASATASPGWKGFVSDVTATLSSGSPVELVVYATVPAGYTLLVADSALRSSQIGADEWDKAGDSLANTHQSTTSFTVSTINITETDSLPTPVGVKPEITMTDPIDGATGVNRDYPVTITFSKMMDTTSVGFTSTPDPGGWVGSWNASGTEVTYMHNPFDSTTTYAIDVFSGADLGGNFLVNSTPWSFTTGMALGITQLEEQLLEVRFLPNPAIGGTFVELQHRGAIQVFVMDMLGRTVKQVGMIGSRNMQTSDLPEGSYIVVAADDSGKAIARGRLTVIR
jgi:hypothetical protein